MYHSEQNREQNDKIVTGFILSDKNKYYEYNLAGLFILYRGA